MTSAQPEWGIHTQPLHQKHSGDITEEGMQGPKEPEKQDKSCNMAGTQLLWTLSNMAASQNHSGQHINMVERDSRGPSDSQKTAGSQWLLREGNGFSLRMRPRIGHTNLNGPS